jgi:hypothetical protein
MMMTMLGRGALPMLCPCGEVFHTHQTSNAVRNHSRIEPQRHSADLARNPRSGNAPIRLRLASP